MRYISEDGNSIGFAIGEDVVFEWEIYEDPSRKKVYEVQADEKITFAIMDHRARETVLAIAGREGERRIEIGRERTGEMEPGRYTAIAALVRGDGTCVQIWPTIDACSNGIYPHGNCLIAVKPPRFTI